MITFRDQYCKTIGAELKVHINEDGINEGTDPKKKRPELWILYNGKINKGESIRVFPLSNWTELDIWTYIKQENIPISELYYAKEREVVVHDHMLIPYVEGKTPLAEGEKPEMVMCRFRTLGCWPCTGAVRSEATSLDEIITETMTVRVSERITRIIDHDQEGSMEQKSLSKGITILQ